MCFVKLGDPISRVRIGKSLDNNHIFEKEAFSRRINDLGLGF
jgi:hypothetical protein